MIDIKRNKTLYVDVLYLGQIHYSVDESEDINVKAQISVTSDTIKIKTF
jgi:hypothetical protein